MAQTVDSPCTANECQMSLRTARFELAFEKSLSLTKQLLAGDHLRALRVEHVLLEADNDGLLSQLEYADTCNIAAIETECNSRKQISDASDEIARLQAALRAECQEIECLKKEIVPLNDTSHESQRLVEENLRLAKELSSLRPELEHLKAQSASYQALLSDKLSLEQQLKSLSSQLESERRSFERLQVGGMNEAGEEKTRLNTHVKDLRNEVAKESRERQRLEEEIKKQSIDWERERTALENKLESVRRKLRTTKEKLKVSQDELQQRVSVAKDEDMDGALPRSNTNTCQQESSHFDVMTINTPGAVHISRDTKKSSTLPGHKSTFSITPFLSRTGAPPDSPDSTGDINERPSDQSGGNEDMPDTENDTTSIQRPVRKVSGANRPVDLERPMLVSKPTYDARSMNVPDGKKAGPPSDAHALSNETSMVKQVKPRKRKLLGMQRNATLFDEDDDGVQEKRHGWKGGPGEKRSLAPAPSKIYNNPGLGTDLDGTFGVSTGFSPLKRDRRRL